jgi:hypothetical protein
MQRLKSQTQLQKESLSQKTLTRTLKNSYTQLRLLTGPIFSDRSTSNIITQDSKIFPFFGENNIERTKILLQTSSPSTKIKTSSISQTTLQMNIISALFSKKNDSVPITAVTKDAAPDNAKTIFFDNSFRITSKAFSLLLLKSTPFEKLIITTTTRISTTSIRIRISQTTTDSICYSTQIYKQLKNHTSNSLLSYNSINHQGNYNKTFHDSSGLLDSPVSLRRLVVIKVTFMIHVILLIILFFFCFYKKYLRSVNSLENNLRLSLQTVSLNNLTENQLSATNIQKLNHEIQGVNRIIKLHDRLIKDAELNIFDLSQKIHFSKQSSKSDIMAESTVIRHEHVACHFILDKSV